MTNESVAFDRAASYYDSTRGFPPGVEADVGALMVKTGGLSKSSRVLEIGVGTGRIALPVAPHVHAYYGIDLARPMMERLLEKKSTEPIYIVEGDATRLPYPTDSFDAVIAVHVFHLIPGWRDVLKELARVLRPGGMLLHGWNEPLTTGPLQAIWNKTTDDVRGAAGAIGWSERKTFLPDSGWREYKDVQTHIFTVEHAPADYLDSLRKRRWSSTWRMSEETVQRGIAAVEAAIAANYADPTQPIPSQATFKIQAYLPPSP